MSFTALKDCMDRMVNEYNTPGVDVMVYKEHEPVFRYFTGVSDLESGKKINGNELYIIFSMTKMLTCTGALQLYENGKYNMDDPLYKYMPEFKNMKVSCGEHNSENAKKVTQGISPVDDNLKAGEGYAKNPITIKNLFTMCAGFNYDLGAEYFKDAIENGKKTTAELIDAMKNTVLGFEPGTRFNYSLCHDVLGALIEVWSGKKFGDYMRENVFEPIGMKNTFFGVPKDEKRLSKIASLYVFDENRKPVKLKTQCVYNFTDEYQSGGAGLISCTEDYALFLDALANKGVAKNGNRILLPETVELMGTNQLSGQPLADFNELRNGYGYGMGVRTHINKEKSGSLSPLGEFGWDGAAGAFSMVDIKNKLSLTYFQHIHNWDLNIQSEIRNALYKDLNL